MKLLGLIRLCVKLLLTVSVDQTGVRRVPSVRESSERTQLPEEHSSGCGCVAESTRSRQRGIRPCNVLLRDDQVLHGRLG